MRTDLIALAAAAGLLTAAGCGRIVIEGGEGDEGQTRVFADVTFDEAWEATIEAFEELRLPIDNLERASGVVTTDWILIEDDEADEYMDCEDATRNAEGRFNVFLREVGDGVRVTVNAAFRAEDDSGRRLVCDSDGEYEDLIMRQIRSELA